MLLSIYSSFLYYSFFIVATSATVAATATTATANTNTNTNTNTTTTTNNNNVGVICNFHSTYYLTANTIPECITEYNHELLIT